MTDRIPLDAPVEHGSKRAPLKPGSDPWKKLRASIEADRDVLFQVLNRMAAEGRADEAAQPSPYAMADALGGVLAKMDSIEQANR